jgi:hypothetical protein
VRRRSGRGKVDWLECPVSAAVAVELGGWGRGRTVRVDIWSAMEWAERVGTLPGGDTGREVERRDGWERRDGGEGGGPSSSSSMSVWLGFDEKSSRSSPS